MSVTVWAQAGATTTASGEDRRRWSGNLGGLGSRGSPEPGPCLAPCPSGSPGQLKSAPLLEAPNRGGRGVSWLEGVPGWKPQMVWCLLTWKPLGRWCPSGQLGRWAAQARKEALTTRPLSGCGGRKLFTMWTLSSSSEVKSRPRNFSILRKQKRCTGLWPSYLVYVAQPALLLPHPRAPSCTSSDLSHTAPRRQHVGVVPVPVIFLPACA